MSLDGGYKVIPYDLHDILASQAFAYPTALFDDSGWFADSSVQLTLTRDLAFTAKLSYMASEMMPVGSPTQSAATGLFNVTQQPGSQLSTDAGLRWGITQSFSVSAGWTHQYLTPLPFFTSSDMITAEILGLEPNGRFGGSLSLAVSPTPTGVLQQPLVRMSGFWKISDAVKLQIDGDDLLSPLIPGGRLDLAPYITPGFRLTGSLGMSL